MGIVALTHSDQQSTNWYCSRNCGKCDWWWSDCGGTGSNRHSSAGLESHCISELEQKRRAARLRKLMNIILVCLGVAGVYVCFRLYEPLYIYCIEKVYMCQWKQMTAASCPYNREITSRQNLGRKYLNRHLSVHSFVKHRGFLSLMFFPAWYIRG